MADHDSPTVAEVEAAAEQLAAAHMLAGTPFLLAVAVGGQREWFRKQARAALTAAATVREPFQTRVSKWIDACFGPEIGADRIERNHRFLEEALELVQANGCGQSEAHQLVDYVFGRPVGELSQEVGGVMNTLASLCTASGVDLDGCAEAEMARVWTKMETIRAKRAAKPKHSPLPQHAATREGWRPIAEATEGRPKWGAKVGCWEAVNWHTTEWSKGHFRTYLIDMGYTHYLPYPEPPARPA